MAQTLWIGRDSQIGSFSKLKAADGRLAIGRRVSIATGCFISPHAGGISIGDDSVIGPNCVIVAGNYRYNRLDVPIQQQGHESKGILIGRDVWIGGGVTVLDGTAIGDHAIVMAGSVVSGQVPEAVVVGGAPARVILKRS